MKIGAFIASCRKEKSLSQAALAEKLGITDRAVSKWETGKCMPNVFVMMELCGILGISVNELLTGEHIEKEDYKDNAEEILVEMAGREEDYNKRLLLFEKVIGYLSSITFIILIFAASFAVESVLWRIIMIVAGAVIFTVGVVFCLKIEHEAGYYECPYCGNRYVPAMKEIVFSMHMGQNRRLKCPACGNRGYHKKVLTK